jgi:homocysteine S-methyltransferase
MTLTSKFPIILDGGMGRELESMGAPFKQPEWSAQALIDSPEFVFQAHRNFIDAGAEIITTNTYALVPFHIGEKRFNEQGAELIKRAAHIARSCITENEKVQVAGCIPPVLGSYRPDLFSKSQAQPIIDLFIQQQQSDVDFWLAETISSIDEAALIKERTASTGKPTWMAFTVKDQLTTIS